MSGNRKSELMALAINSEQVRPAGRLTVPRSYGVYQISGLRRDGRAYRFGNHPIRQHELANKYGEVHCVALFPERKLAEELAACLNRT